MSPGPALRRRRDDHQTTRTALKPIDTPWSDEGATIACPACGRDFTPSGRARYCSDACRKKAWRRRHQAAPTPVVLPPGIARRPITVYECAFCGGRSVGELLKISFQLRHRAGVLSKSVVYRHIFRQVMQDQLHFLDAEFFDEKLNHQRGLKVGELQMLARFWGEERAA